MANARESGLRASIYRPGALTAPLGGGSGQVDDFLTRFIAGIIQLGSCPELDATVDFAPVDAVSRVIVELARTPGPGRTYHLTHPHPFGYDEFIQAIRASGYQVDTSPFHEWEAQLARLRYEDGNALYTMSSLFTESTAPVFRRARLDLRNAREHSRLHTAAYPPIGDLLPLYLKRLAEDGFLPQSGARVTT